MQPHAPAPKLVDYLNRHSGETAWIFGKGPSLDRFDMREAGPLRCAINDVVARVPGCVYAFSNDGVQDWADLYKPGHTLFSPHRPEQPSELPCKVVRYNDDYSPDLARVSRASLAGEPLSIERGTLGSAVQILWIMGVTRIVCVGIDGGQAHASGGWRTRLRNEHYKDYNAIRDCFILLCELFGIDLEFHGMGPVERRKGQMKIRLKASVFVDGTPYSDGHIAEIRERLARDLIGMRLAEEFIAPVRDETIPCISTAARETQSAEHAREIPENRESVRGTKRRKRAEKQLSPPQEKAE